VCDENIYLVMLLAAMTEVRKRMKQVSSGQHRILFSFFSGLDTDADSHQDVMSDSFICILRGFSFSSDLV